jgi:histone acetyltransferase
MGEAAPVEVPVPQEAPQRTEFRHITNDGSRANLILLTYLKNVYGTQLPKMPKEYIARLVFDKNHKSVIIVRGEENVIGGICYRPFYPQRFAEIAFCAVMSDEQVKGFGTKVMNHLKEICKADGIEYFLTYADNYAIGYFKKQGFQRTITMPRDRWAPFIKDYEGGTLMEFYVNPNIPYLDVPKMVAQQRAFVEAAIRKRVGPPPLYPPVPQFLAGASSVAPQEIPGVLEAGWSPNQTSAKSRRLEAATSVSRAGGGGGSVLGSQLQEVLESISGHHKANVFLQPVDETIAPRYFEIVTEPMDLSTMQRKLSEGAYLTKELFEADLKLIFENCRKYNGRSSIYAEMANELDKFATAEMQRLVP